MAAAAATTRAAASPRACRCGRPAPRAAARAAAARPGGARRAPPLRASAAEGVGGDAAIADAEEVLLRAAEAAGGRAAQSSSSAAESEVEAAIAALVASGGEPRPARSAKIEGEWVLAYTSKSSFSAAAPLGRRTDGSAPGLEALFKAASDLLGAPAPEGREGGAAAAGAASSSPLQRAITAIPFVDVTQRIELGIASGAPRDDWRCDQFVRSRDGRFELQLVALAEGGADERGCRVDFTFDSGTIRLRDAPLVGSVELPYPVPFKLLGDEAKGWLDTLYLSDRVRISKGNKGTTFILVKAPQQQQQQQQQQASS